MSNSLSTSPNHGKLLAEWDHVAPQIINPNDAKSRGDLDLFRRLLCQFLEEPCKVDWARIRPMPPEAQKPYEELPRVEDKAETEEIMARLVVVKLNGGLGTTMGCAGPKSLVQVREGLNFLEFALRQHELLNANTGPNAMVPLLLMNSFNTDADTKQYLQHNFKTEHVRCFCQSRCPRIFANSMMPVPTDWNDRMEEGWYPPGHGNAFWAMEKSGILDELLAQGRDVAFFANIDNTGAVVDERIAKVLVDGRADYVMEMTPRTAADVKGGTLVEIEDGNQRRLMHLECPQVPDDRLDEFCSLRTFKIFNTNNIWVNLRVVKQRLAQMRMEILANQKTLSSGERVIQLEQSIGGAIRNFPGRAMAICVGRNRFIPVKSTRDLFRVRSPDLFRFSPAECLLHQLVPTLPEVHLSAEFSRLADFEQRIPEVPRMERVESVRLEGDIWMGRGVRMEGMVDVRTCGQEPLRIGDNSVLGQQNDGKK